jgi:hypothetical protein
VKTRFSRMAEYKERERRARAAEKRVGNVSVTLPLEGQQGGSKRDIIGYSFNKSYLTRRLSNKTYLR